MFRGQNFIRMCVVNKSNQRQNTTAQELFHLHKDHGFPPPPPPPVGPLFSGEEQEPQGGKGWLLQGREHEVKKGAMKIERDFRKCRELNESMLRKM